MIGPIPIPAAGERATGRFTFAGDAGLARYEWPYIAFAGASRGPTFLVTAGIHAAEYTGIEAAIRLGVGFGEWRCQNRFFALWRLHPEGRETLRPLADVLGFRLES